VQGVSTISEKTSSAANTGDAKRRRCSPKIEKENTNEKKQGEKNE
jgi:hypothetical protein